MQINEFSEMLLKILSKSPDLNLLSRVIHKKMNYTKKLTIETSKSKVRTRRS